MTILIDKEDNVNHWDLILKSVFAVKKAKILLIHSHYALQYWFRFFFHLWTRSYQDFATCSWGGRHSLMVHATKWTKTHQNLSMTVQLCPAVCAGHTVIGISVHLFHPFSLFMCVCVHKGSVHGDSNLIFTLKVFFFPGLIKDGLTEI